MPDGESARLHLFIRGRLVSSLVFALAFMHTAAFAIGPYSLESFSPEVRIDNELCQKAFLSKEFTRWKQSYQSGRFDQADRLWGDLIKQVKGSKSCGRLLTRARDTIDLNLADDQVLDVLKLYTHFHRSTIKALGPDHPAVASTARFMAQELEARNKFTEALPYRKMELSIREKQFGKMHPYAINSLQDMAQHYIDQKAYSEAAPILKVALERWVALKNQIGIKETSADYVRTLEALGKTQQASEIKRKYHL